MRHFPRAIVFTVAALSLLWVAAFARELGSREARVAIAEALAIEKPDRVRIKSISAGPGNQAIVEANIEAAFRLTQDNQGNWRAIEARVGDRKWESLELIHTAVRKEKILRTTADLRTLATALEAFRRERGFYVAAETGSALLDNLAPRYLPMIIRLDAWSREFQYDGSLESYRLLSLGPDGKAQTEDDIIIVNGRLLKGESE